MEHVTALQMLLLVLLAAVALFAALAQRLSLSYPIVLVLAGLICSVLPHVPRVPLSPNMVLYVLLPPLLYAAAWQTSWREFQQNMVSVALLAIGLVFFTAVGVAIVAQFFLPGFDWRLGFLLGAIVSPTDAVAASSIAKKLGLPHTILDLLEGESLLNDATGLLALQFGLDLIVHGAAPPLGRAALEFAWLLGGGVAIGLAVGWIVTWVERWIEDGPIEIAFSVLVAYVSYLAGDAAHASGVISVVVCGLYLSRKSSRLFTPESRLQLTSAWGAFEFLLNGIVFLLIGLQLPGVLANIRGYSALRLCCYGLAFSGVLIALRLVWMFPGARLAYLIRTRLLHQQYQMPGRRSIFIVGWTGMRGVVALAAAGSLPYTVASGRALPQRNVIVFLTFAVILVTLVLQGLTLPAVVRALGLKKDPGPKCEEDEARQLLLDAGITFLKSSEAEAGEAQNSAYTALRGMLEARKQELQASFSRDQGDSETQLTRRTAMLGVFQSERDQLIQLRADGRIGDGVYRTLERELDLGESRLASRK